MASSGFFTLPRELRDKILSLVVSTISEAPADHLSEKDQDRIKQNIWHMDNVKARPRMNRIDWIPSLLVNRQLHNETLAAIDILPSKHSYVLDIMVMNGSELWPTWLYVPKLTNDVDKVYTSVHIDKTSAKTYSGFRRGCGGPPMITWSFQSILERFIEHGPVVNPENSNGSLAIKVLEMDIITPNVPDSAFIPEGKIDETINRSRRRRREALLAETPEPQDQYMIPSHYLASFLALYMDDLIRQYDDKHYYDRCWFLFERIGIMKLMIDGEPYREWDMAQELKNANRKSTFRRKGRHAYKKWKTGVYEARRLYGLYVLPDDFAIDSDDEA